MGMRLERVTKIYNEHTATENKVLSEISLEIESGEMVAIIGKSGSGKSTLLHILGCLDTISKGSYQMDGLVVNEINNKQKARLRNEKTGFILQDFGLIPDDTVLASVMLPMMFDKTRLSTMKEKAYQALEQVGIRHLARNQVKTLSGGEKQRTAIARALVKNPEYILADEPTGALDSENAGTFMKLLKELHQKNKTVVIVTHDMEIAEQCGRIIRIADGRLIL